MCLFGLQEHGRDSSRLVLSADQQPPQLLHERPRLLLQEPSQLQLQVLAVQIVLLECVLHEANDDLVFKTKQLRHLLLDPFKYHRKLHFADFDFCLQDLTALQVLEHFLVLIAKAVVLARRGAAKEHRHGWVVVVLVVAAAVVTEQDQTSREQSINQSTSQPASVNSKASFGTHGECAPLNESGKNRKP